MTSARTFFALGLFLILAGLLGFLSNPSGAKTALISGGTFGSIFLACAWGSSQGWAFVRWVGLGTMALLIPVFIWRSTVSWMAFAEGESSKWIAALLISSMLVATAIGAYFALRSPLRKEPQER